MLKLKTGVYVVTSAIDLRKAHEEYYLHARGLDGELPMSTRTPEPPESYPMVAIFRHSWTHGYHVSCTYLNADELVTSLAHMRKVDPQEEKKNTQNWETGVYDVR